ncbi:unnamed protein product [Mytilus edulis]|uniref:Endonuclease/exonuclease/phosphatase domain-containing protein n=1 Tax=Mytilus edulis TaxID=6550 RepID=A0A8S3S0L6_MYTED|nr:unnamed protein product [Mytilus edulis]
MPYVKDEQTFPVPVMIVFAMQLFAGAIEMYKWLNTEEPVVIVNETTAEIQETSNSTEEQNLPSTSSGDNDTVVKSNTKNTDKAEPKTNKKPVVIVNETTAEIQETSNSTEEQNLPSTSSGNNDTVVKSNTKNTDKAENKAEPKTNKITVHATILFCGDLNARTSTEEDYIAQDSSRYLPLFESYKPDNQIRFRKNCDETLDSRGKEIIDLCISNQMRVVNGRCMGDLLGHFTCFNTHGQSTVDYLIANERLFNQILYFRVSEFVSTFSDCHCKISWEILAKYQITETQSNNLHAAPVNFRWTEDSPLKFQQALLSPDNQQKISSFLINDSDCSSEDINKKAQDLCDIFLSAAKISLVTPKKRIKRVPDPRKNGKIYSRYPKDPVIKGRYYKHFRIYNKCRKVKYKQFINSMLQKLDTLRVENPKQYWKLINDIQDSKKENCSSQIDSDTWANHFRNLHSAIDNTFYSRLNQLEMILNDKEKNLVFNDLDNDISKKEISDAIASLKSGKACGPDLISNEMLKYSQSYLIGCLYKLFNLCLKNSVYPKIWADGFISPIFKSDDPCDPSNYRGITITSTIGKLFNNILNTRLDKGVGPTQGNHHTRTYHSSKINDNITPTSLQFRLQGNHHTYHSSKINNNITPISSNLDSRQSSYLSFI